MPTKAQARSTTRSTPRLSEVARHLVVPHGIVTTGWPAVAARCAEWGDSFDLWQQGLGSVALGRRADGLYAATIGGVVISIPRQVAKTFLVMRIVFALCTLFPGLRVIWTAHRMRTATNTFQKMHALAKRKGAAKYVENVRVANGEQEIRFRNDSTIMFGAREQGFGRGFDEVDIEVFDEAQILTEKALEDMLAAMNQSRHEHGALAFFMGTPPRPIDPGDAFEEFRSNLLSGENRDGVYIETSADPAIGRKGGPSLDDHKQWGMANPSFPHRTPLASMLRLRKLLPGDDAWRREAMGVWDERGQLEPSVLDPAMWDELIGEPVNDGQVAYGIRFAPDGSRVSMAGARSTGEGFFVECFGSASPTAYMDALVSWVVDRWRDLDAVVIDGRGAADVFEQRLLERGVNRRRIVRSSTVQAAAAYAGLLDLVESGRVSHSGQPGLRASVAGSSKRKIGNLGAWGYAPNHPDADSAPVESVALAISGIKQRKIGADGRTRQGRTSGGRQGVVM